LGIRGLITGGDVIVAIGNAPVNGADDVVRIVSALKPKDVAVFTVVRDGKRQKLAVTLAERQLPSD
jgi:S1-C subfamily serine protease